jgi:hypothetical protein
LRFAFKNPERCEVVFDLLECAQHGLA